MDPRQWGSFRNFVKFGVSGIEYVCMYVGGEGVKRFQGWHKAYQTVSPWGSHRVGVPLPIPAAVQ